MAIVIIYLKGYLLNQVKNLMKLLVIKSIFIIYMQIFVSYDSEIGFSYTVNQEAYYSASLVHQDKNGFIEINNYENDQYLIEIMYNYAKIEVVAYEKDIKKVVAYAMSILTSITYNNSVIENYLGEDIFESSEEKYDIFEIVGSDNYLQFTEDIEVTDEIRDPDYVNQEGGYYGFSK